MKFRILFFLSAFVLSAGMDLLAQGPPITTDKPIMLGANKATVRTLAFYRDIPSGGFFALPLMFDYSITNNFEMSIELPLVFPVGMEQEGNILGDASLKAKYQFYRKDETGKTTRFAAVSKYTAPTGRDMGIPILGLGDHQIYAGIVGGIESIRYGIQTELGYMLMPDKNDYLMAKAGFGLPVLKPTYPVNQLNIYFEYESMWMPAHAHYALYYAQGLQYAKGKATWEVAVQLPLLQEVSSLMERNYTVFAGFRYIL